MDVLCALLTHAETRDDVTHVYACGLINLHELHYYFFLIYHLQLYMYCARTRLIVDKTLSSAAGDQDDKTVLALV